MSFIVILQWQEHMSALVGLSCDCWGTAEVSIRKLVGASTFQITRLMSPELLQSPSSTTMSFFLGPAQGTDKKRHYCRFTEHVTAGNPCTISHRLVKTEIPLFFFTVFPGELFLNAYTVGEEAPQVTWEAEAPSFPGQKLPIFWEVGLCEPLEAQQGQVQLGGGGWESRHELYGTANLWPVDCVRLPREMVASPSLEVLKGCVDMALSDLVYWWDLVGWVTGWTWWSWRSFGTWTILWSLILPSVSLVGIMSALLIAPSLELAERQKQWGQCLSQQRKKRHFGK